LTTFMNSCDQTAASVVPALPLCNCQRSTPAARGRLHPARTSGANCNTNPKF
jgi:hypothetical protein